MVTTEIKDKIVELYKAGKSAKDISSGLNVNINTVYYTLRNHVPTGPGSQNGANNPKTPPEVKWSPITSSASAGEDTVKQPEASGSVEESTPHKIEFTVAKKDIKVTPTTEEPENNGLLETEPEEEQTVKPETKGIKVSRLFQKVPNLKNVVFRTFHINELTEDEMKEDTEDWKEFAEVWSPEIGADPKMATLTNVLVGAGFQVFARLDEIFPKIKEIKNKEPIKSTESTPKPNQNLKPVTEVKKEEAVNAPTKSNNPNDLDYWLTEGERH